MKNIELLKIEASTIGWKNASVRVFGDTYIVVVGLLLSGWKIGPGWVMARNVGYMSRAEPEQSSMSWEKIISSTKKD